MISEQVVAEKYRLTAECAEVFAEERRGYAFLCTLCDDLGALCG
jgi:hypothetical protein